jgi:protein-histidine N-methyltransferase
LFIFGRALAERKNDKAMRTPLFMTVADYNPTVLQLVTLPNFILAWAHASHDDASLKDAFTMEGELELSDGVKEAFQKALVSADISITWLTGGWSGEFVDLLYASDGTEGSGALVDTLILGAETIYSPFALDAFYATIAAILDRERAGRPGCRAQALVGAKRLYFGVGGSLDDFVVKAREGGMQVEQLKEEIDGVRRGVVLCEKLKS